jgi:hypothetical protein
LKDGFKHLVSDSKSSLINLLDWLISFPESRSVQQELELLEPKFRLDNAYRSLLMVERIRLLYSTMGYPCPRLININLQTEDLQKYSDLLIQWGVLYRTGKAEKLAKYQSVSLFNKLTGVEKLPEEKLPFGWVTGSLCPWGSLHRKVMRNLRRQARLNRDKFFSLLQNFLYFKKGCPKSSPELIAQSLQSHKEALTRGVDKKLSPMSDGDHVVMREVIKTRIKRICQDTFRNYTSPTHWWDPSNSASFSAGQAMGGQCSEVSFVAPGWRRNLFCHLGLLAKKRIDMSHISDLSLPSLPTDDNWTFHDTGFSIVKVPIVVIPDFSIGGFDEKEFGIPECNSNQNFRITYGENYQLDLEQVDWKFLPEIRAKPVALTEPLKVRVITCEDSWSTYSLKGAQMKLWECLKNHPWFVLTGRPVEAIDIPQGDLPWISVDYKAATDNLHKDMSYMVIKRISKMTGLPLELCYDSLCNHSLVYKDDKRLYPQENGQLMGSILSFIVLCIANAAIISLSVNPAGYNPDTKILVNGDDGLFLGGKREYELWHSLSSHVGLTPSVGKTYHSDEFCVINSQLFRKTEQGITKEIPYPNPSGMMQFDARTYSKPVSPLDLREAHSIWVNGFDEEDKEEAETLWYSTFDSILKTDWVENYAVSWNLPKALGGLGLPVRIRTIRSQKLSRLNVARAKYSLEKGPIFTFRSTMWADKRGYYNPFSIGHSCFYSVSSTIQPTEWELDALRFLGYSHSVEVTGFVGQSYDQFYPVSKEPLGQNISAITSAVLNGLQTAKVVPRKSEKLDFREYFRLLEGKGDYERFWAFQNHELVAEQLNSFTFNRRSGSVIPWVPKIPGNGLTDHYNDFLTALQDSRKLVVSEKLFRDD